VAETVLVTGGTGFIGRHLIGELQRSGIPVVTPSRREIGPDTEWHDVLDGIGVVVHLAALAHQRAEACERSRNYETLRRVNALGSERLARVAAICGVKHFVFVSTIGVHGEETFGAPLNEESPIAPKSLYAASKAEGERLLDRLAAEMGLSVTILRPTLVYGPGNPGNLLRLLTLVNRGWPLPFGSIENRRSLTYVGNLVDSIVTLLAQPVRGDTFIVCDSEPISTPALVAKLASSLNRPIRLFPFPPRCLEFATRAIGRQDIGRRLLSSLEADAGKIARIVSWRPPYRTEHGLSETAAWYRSLQH
jgi:nucleoside-diphosphate-sugar epimerase